MTVPAPPSPTRTVEVFADVRCPFTHVGLRRLVDRRALGTPFRLRVRAWPLELVNGAPLDARLIAEEVDELRRTVAPDLFAGFDVSQWPETSLPALGLVAAAYATDQGTGERASLRVRAALFEEGRDIADPRVLADLALELGIGEAVGGHDAVLADWDEGRHRGVIGSPHFFVDGAGFFCPALRIERIDGHLRIEDDPSGFEAFVDRCLAA